MPRFSRSAIAALALAVIAAFLVAGPTPPAGAATITVAPSADAMVTSQYRQANYGGGALRTSASNPNARSYLRFDIGDVGPIESATLRLYATSSSNSGPNVRVTDGSSWDESSIVWANRPRTGGPIMGSSGAVQRNRWVEIDLDMTLEPNQTYSFILLGGASTWFRSSEQANGPQLQLEVGGAAGGGGGGGGGGNADVQITVDRGQVESRSQMDVGVTNNLYTLNPNGNQAAVARATDLMEEVGVVQVQPIMGNGVGNPNPAPGVYRWATLDARIQQIRDTGGIPVINLWGAPDWMKGGNPWQTDWSEMDTAPLPEHIDDFAELARRAAIRYPDVDHFIVWNENKGLWNRDLANFDYVRYTDMYNAIYDAVKSVDSANEVGGPYIVLEGTGSNIGTIFASEPLVQRNVDFIEYWLDNANGYDFLAVDRKLAQRGDTHPYTNAEEMALTPYFGIVTDRLGQLTSLPVWWVESYFRCDASEDFMAAGLASMLHHQMDAGSEVSLRWNAEQQRGANTCEWAADSKQYLWTTTHNSSGGYATPAHAVYVAFADHFSPGTLIVEASSSSATVEVVASRDVTMLINKGSNAVTVSLDGQTVNLGAYEVKVVPV